MTYLIYKKSNGEISRSIQCQPGFIDKHVSESEGWIKGDPSITWLTHKVVDGELVAHPTPRVQPTTNHTWDDQALVWVDPRTLQEIKDAKWESIKLERETRETGTFQWNGHTIDADKARINGASTGALIANGAGVPYSDAWTLADNSTISVTGDDILAMGVALLQHVSACHARARDLRLLIEAATTKDQVDAITWETAV